MDKIKVDNEITFAWFSSEQIPLGEVVALSRKAWGPASRLVRVVDAQYLAGNRWRHIGELLEPVYFDEIEWLSNDPRT